VFAALPAFASASGSGDGTDGDGLAPAKLTFSNRLRIPPLAQPKIQPGGVKRFELVMQSSRVEILPGKKTATWGFNGPFPRPDDPRHRGETVQLAVTNDLGRDHYGALARHPAARPDGRRTPSADRIRRQLESSIDD